MAFSQISSSESEMKRISSVMDKIKEVVQKLQELVCKFPKPAEFHLKFESMQYRIETLKELSDVLPNISQDIYEAYNEIITLSGEKTLLEQRKEELIAEYKSVKEQLEKAEQHIVHVKRKLDLSDDASPKAIDRKIAKLQKALPLLLQIMEQLELDPESEDAIIIEKIVEGRAVKSSIEELKAVLNLEKCTDEKVVRKAIAQLLEYRKTSHQPQGINAKIGNLVKDLRDKESRVMKEFHKLGYRDIMLIGNKIHFQPPKGSAAQPKVPPQPDALHVQLENKIKLLKDEKIQLTQENKKIKEEMNVLREEARKQQEHLEAKLADQNRNKKHLEIRCDEHQYKIKHLESECKKLTEKLQRVKAELDI